MNKKKKREQKEIKDLKVIDFLCSPSMCLFWRLLCFNIVYQKDFSGFHGRGKEGGAGWKLSLEKIDWLQNWE